MSYKLDRVAIDLRGTEPGFKAHYGRGTGRYATELYSAICSISESKPKGILSSELKLTRLEESVLCTLPFGRCTLSNQVFLPRKLRGLDADLFHFVAHGDAPLFCPKPYIATVLDLIPLRFPELYAPKRMTWRFKLARYLELQAIKRAKGIIAISENTKQDLISLLGIERDRILVTPLAVGAYGHDGSAKTSVNRNEVKRRMGLPTNAALALYVGGIDGRKNVSFLFNVLVELKKRDTVLHLALVGSHKNDDNYPGLVADIECSGLKAQIHQLGYLSDEDLFSLYGAADLFLFPSLYEGFGLPVLEAMGRGLPVVALKRSSIPEVAGNACVLIEEADSQRWGDVISSLLNDSGKLSALSKAGLVRAADFTWEKTAQATLEAYQYFLGSESR